MIIPTDERLITDKQVFEAIDLSAAGLEKTAAAYHSGDIDKAKKELSAYFYNRKSVSYFFDYRAQELTPINPEDNPYAFSASLGFGTNLKQFCLDAAEKMMKNIYVLPGEGRGEIPLGDNFENMIHFNFLTDNGQGHRNYLDMFVRGQFFEYLAILYHERGEKRVCEHFVKVFNKFKETYPLQVVDISPQANRFQFDEDRDAMSVGFLALSYISLLYTRLPYDVGYELVFELVQHIWFLGLQFRRFDTDTYKPYNHHMWERGLIPFILGTLFPEIPDFAKMQKHGAQIVSRHVKDDFNTEGGYNEHSIAYWAGAALGEMLYRGASLARLNKAELLDADALQRLDKSFTVLAAISPPSERYPALGDNRGPLVKPILQLGVFMTGNSACRKLIDGEALNNQKLPLDYSNALSGFVCMRSSFEKTASYVLMSAKIDCGASGHNHMDMLSLFVTIKGVSIIGEPYADGLYRKGTMGSAQRAYLYNMRAHNTVLCFGESVVCDKMLADKWGVYRPDSPITEFVSSELGTYVSAYHVGYVQCRHTRKLLFSRSGALLVRDEIARGNRVAEPHLQRWHLMQGSSVQVYDKFCIVQKDGLKLLFLWDKADSIKLSDDREILCPDIVKDTEEPAPIIDVSFSNMHDITTDLLMVPINMLILDISNRAMPSTKELCREMADLALQMDSPHALKRLISLEKN